MIGYLFRFFIILIAVLIQTTILEDIKIINAKLDLVLILTTYFAFIGGIMLGQTSGFTGGLLEDIFGNPDLTGISTLIKTIIGFGVGNLYKRVYTANFISIFTIILIVTTVKAILFILINHFFSSPWTWIDIYGYFKDTLLIELLLNSIVAPFIFSGLNKLNLNIKKED